MNSGGATSVGSSLSGQFNFLNFLAMDTTAVMLCLCFRCDLFDANLQQTVEVAEKYGLSAV